MKTRILLLFLLCFSIPVVPSSIAQDGGRDANVLTATPLPEIAFVPRSLTLTMDTSRFLSAEVKVLNRGGSPLQLQQVKASCGCASGTVMKNPVNPMEVGTILIRINTANITDTLMRVDFSVENNSATSSAPYHVYVRNPFAKK